MAKIRIDMDKRCSRCGEEGSTQNGLCLKCITKGIKKGEWAHITGRARRQGSRGV